MTPAAGARESIGPDLVIDRAGFRETLCADAPADLAQVREVSQRPLAVAAIGEPLAAEGAYTARNGRVVFRADTLMVLALVVSAVVALALIVSKLMARDRAHAR